ncbi:MAG: tetratricopeptide repeat protein, partial [bacterium]
LEVFKKQHEADTFMDLGDSAKAAEAYSAVLRLDPNRFELYPKLGDLLVKLGDIPGACVRYREIGNLYLKNRLIKKALPLFQKVAELVPDDFETHVALADLHAKAGNDSEAKKEVLYLTEVLFQRDDLEQALQYAQKAEQLKAIESYSYLGHIDLKNGKRDEARVWFDKLLKFKPNHGGALWGMGLIHIAEGRVEDARQVFAKVSNSDRFYGEVLASTADLEAPSNPEAARERYQEAIGLIRAKGMLPMAKALEAKLRAIGGTPLASAGPEESPVVAAVSAEAVAEAPKKNAVAPVAEVAPNLAKGPAVLGAKADEAKPAPVVVKPAEKGEAPKVRAPEAPTSKGAAAKAAPAFLIQRFTDQPETAAKPPAEVSVPLGAPGSKVETA